MKKEEVLEKAVHEIVSKVKKRYPKVKFAEISDWPEADVAITLETWEDNGIKISELTAPIQIKYLEKYGLDIVVLPIESGNTHSN